MNSRRFVVSSLVATMVLATLIPVFGQSTPTTPDLGRLADTKSLNAFNRTASRLDDAVRVIEGLIADALKEGP